MHNDALVAEILALSADIHRAEFRLLELIAELDAQRPWRHEALPSCAHWLNAHCGIDLVTAREKVRITRVLGELPVIRGAFRDGELSCCCAGTTIVSCTKAAAVHLLSWRWGAGATVARVSACSPQRQRHRTGDPVG